MHADSRAAESARTVDALAYTVGSDIVFGAGQYAPGENAGKRLLALDHGGILERLLLLLLLLLLLRRRWWCGERQRLGAEASGRRR